MRASSIALLLLACAAARPGRAQTVFVEVEPNSVRAEATLVSCLAPGDSITGSSTGTPTNAGDGSPTSADTFRLQTCALPLGIHRHELALSSATPLYVPTLRGLVQAGAPGSGGLVTTTDANFSTGVGAGTPASPRVSAWYGFGRSEELYWRVSGGFQTTQPYVAVYSNSPVSTVFVGNFVSGPITISCVGQGHISDTDLWLYDANFNAIPGAGNDDAFQTSIVQSLLTRTLAPGTYYLAVSGYNLANDQTTPPDDDFAQGKVLDFPDIVATSLGTMGYDVSFAISDAGHSVPVAALVDATRAQEIGWYRFEVLAPFSEAFCFGDGTQVQPCPCANNGATGRGCANSFDPQGAQLVAAGTTSPDTMVLTCSGMPTFSTAIFLKTDLELSGYVYGDGVRCVDGALIRLRQKQAVGGVATFPEPGDPALSVRGQTPPGSASVAYYQAYYRNASTTYCPPATFNISNGWRMVW